MDAVSHTSSEPQKRQVNRLVGNNLRAIRQARGTTLQAAAQLCSVSGATLSRIENGLMSPTFDMMVRISAGLGVSISDLVSHQTESSGDTSVQAWVATTRRGQGRRLETPQYSLEFLCDDVLAKTFAVLRAEILCRNMEEFGPMQAHAGQEQITVLSGRVEVRLEYYRPHELGVGDSLAFDSTQKHAVLAPEGHALVHWVYLPGKLM